MAPERPRPGLPRDELDAALAARRELGEELEPEVVQSFLDRIERGLDARIDERIAAKRMPGRSHLPDWSAFALALTSLGVAVPLTEKATTTGDFFILAAVVAVNAFYNLGRWR